MKQKLNISIACMTLVITISNRRGRSKILQTTLQIKIRKKKKNNNKTAAT